MPFSDSLHSHPTRINFTFRKKKTALDGAQSTEQLNAKVVCTSRPLAACFMTVNTIALAFFFLFF